MKTAQPSGFSSQTVAELCVTVSAETSAPGGGSVAALVVGLGAASGSALATDDCTESDVPPTIVGTEGSDTLTGTAGADVIEALGGNDTIDGLGGNDVICGEGGKDKLHGGAGNDEIHGGDDGEACGAEDERVENRDRDRRPDGERVGGAVLMRYDDGGEDMSGREPRRAGDERDHVLADQEPEQDRDSRGRLPAEQGAEP